MKKKQTGSTEIFMKYAKNILRVLICLTLTWCLALPLPADAADRLPLGAAMCVSKAETLIQKGNFTEAVKTLKAFKAKEKEISPEAAEKKGYSHYYIDFILGNAYLMQYEALSKGRKHYLKLAADAYEEALGKKKDIPAAWLNLAKCRYDSGRMKGAGEAFLNTYENSREKKPSHLYYASICYFQSGENQKARKLFYRLMKNHPSEITLDWRESFVSILFAMDKNREALPYVELLAKGFTGEKRKKWQEILLYQYLDMKMTAKAFKYADSLTRADPVEPKWWKALSHLHLNNNNFKNGLTSLLIYSYLTPLSNEETALMADLYLSLGIPTRAADYYEVVLKGKNSLKKIKRIVDAYIAAHEREKALAWIDRGLALQSDRELLKKKAALVYEMEQYDSAEDVYETLIKQAKKGKS